MLAIVAFVYFAIAGATTHKFTEYHVAGDQKRLASFFAETVQVDILAFAFSLRADPRARASAARPVRRAISSAAMSVMFILAIGMLARAAVGPAERLLNMLGERKQCASIYAIAFAINLMLCVVLIPRIGIEGAAAATSIALVAESIALYLVAKRRLGFHVFIWAAAAKRLKSSPLAQQPPDDLAGRRHRHVVDEGDLARIFVRRRAAS